MSTPARPPSPGARCRRARICLVLGALLCTAVTVDQVAQAQQQEEPSAADRDTARRLLDEGDAHYEAGRYQQALTAYETADKIMGVPTTTVEVGRALEALGKLLEARDMYLRVLRFPKRDNEPDAFGRARQRAGAVADSLKARIATLELNILGLQDPAPASLSIDGVPVRLVSLTLPRRVNPGLRQLELRAPGYRTITRQLRLAEGETQRVELRLEIDPHGPKPGPKPLPVKPAPAPPTPTMPSAGSTSIGYTVLTAVGFSLAGVGLGVGTATGVLVLDREAELADRCPDKQCSLSEQERLDNAELMANLSNAGFGVAGLGAALGVVGLVLIATDSGTPADDTPDKKGAATLHVTPQIGAGWFGIAGQF